MTKSNLITVLVILAVLAGAAYFTYLALNPGENSQNSEAARSLVSADEVAFRYTDLDGNPVDLGQYEGKIRVVNSWATWCPFCKQELADFQALASEAGEDVVVIAINRAEPASKVKAYLAKNGGYDNIVFIQDEADYFYKSIAGFAMPETVYYNQSGAVVVHKRGFMDLSEMQNHLQKTVETNND